MTIQQIVAELENIKEQTLNNSKITTDDVITDCKDHSMDFTFDNEDHYGEFERETDFTALVID